MDPHFHRLMNTYDYESSLFRISPRLRDLRDWKERYIQFNTRNAGHPLKAQEEIEDLIDFYYKTGDEIFVGFASLLSKYRDPIINSFIMVEKNGPGGIYDSRLSNGPVESLNRKVKVLQVVQLQRNTNPLCKYLLYILFRHPNKHKSLLYNKISDAFQPYYQHQAS